MVEIKTRPATPEYRENWDKIFRKTTRQPTDDKTHRLPMTDSEYEYRARLARAWNEGIHA